MKYEFPEIRTIDDVLPHIEGRNEFIVAEKDGYTVINYVVMTPETFPVVEQSSHAILRECRGLIFDTNGKILSRPFHKFFNVNERLETMTAILPRDGNFIVYDKLDGSMVRPIIINGYVRWGTKMGITSTSMECEAWLASHVNFYNRFALYCHDMGCTPIFEWVSPNNRIVLKYDESSLILTAIRDNETGEYFTDSAMRSMAAIENIPVVEKYESNSIYNLIEKTHKAEETEGLVIRWLNGHMVKIKSEWYLRIHKSRDLISNEKTLVKCILNEELDDVKPFLIEEDFKTACDLENEWNKALVKKAEELQKRVDTDRKLCDNEIKLFALGYAPDYEEFQNVAFKIFRDGNAVDAVRDWCLGRLRNLKEFEKLKEIMI